MSLQVLLLVGALTTANGFGPAFPVPSELANRSFVVTLKGTGALAASVIYWVSNDNGVTWAPRLTFELSGNESVPSTDVDENSPFTMVKAQVTGLTGTNASVSLSMDASARKA